MNIIRNILILAALSLAACSTTVERPAYTESATVVTEPVAQPVFVEEDGPDFVIVDGHRMHRHGVEYRHYEQTHQVTYRHRH